MTRLQVGLESAKAAWREIYIVICTFLTGGGLLGNLPDTDWNFSARLIIITMEVGLVTAV